MFANNYAEFTFDKVFEKSRNFESLVNIFEKLTSIGFYEIEKFNKFLNFNRNFA